MSVLWLLLGIAIGALLREFDVRAWRTAARDECAKKAEAYDRLYSAWREGAVIPPPEKPEIPEAPLAPELQEHVDKWEAPDVRAKVEANIRRRINAGRTVDQVLMDLEVE